MAQVPDLYQVGRWIFDPNDVKVVQVEGGAVTLHMEGVSPLELDDDESAAYLKRLANDRSVTVILAPPEHDDDRAPITVL